MKKTKKFSLQGKFESASHLLIKDETKESLNLAKRTMIAGFTTSSPMRKIGRRLLISIKIGKRSRKKKLMGEVLVTKSQEPIENAGER